MHNAREIFHCKYKEERRERVTLAETSTPPEATMDASIKMEEEFNI